MVKTRHVTPSPIVPVEWRSKRPRAEIEVLRISGIAGQMPYGVWERMQFHLFVLYQKGRSEHEVDFAVHPCARGTLIHVQPGQLHRWRHRQGVDGVVVIFKASFLFPDRPRTGALWTERFFEDVAWPVVLQLTRPTLHAVEDWLARLESAARDADDSAMSSALQRHILSATLIEVAQRAALATAPQRATAEERNRAHSFREDVERSFRVTRTVNDYAERLGCSARTLDRTSRDAFGVAAKVYVDARVILEARRLLAHTALSIADIGEDLGFSEATNFVKFFKARTGEAPGTFRAAHVDAAADD